MAEVPRQVDDAHARVCRCDPVEQLGCAVGAAVVDEHQLELVVGDRGACARDELLDQLLLVVDRCDYAEQGGSAEWCFRHVVALGVKLVSVIALMFDERPKPALKLSFILCMDAHGAS